jgi:hypothetical protein
MDTLVHEARQEHTAAYWNFAGTYRDYTLALHMMSMVERLARKLAAILLQH